MVEGDSPRIPRIYFDVCAIQRPLDDKTQNRVALEAAAITTVMELCRRGGAQALTSSVVDMEEGPIRNLGRRFLMSAFRRMATQVDLDATAVAMIGPLMDAGLTGFDAMHLACAIRGGADYFCTCDDRLRRIAISVISTRGLGLSVVTPPELALEVLQ